MKILTIESKSRDFIRPQNQMERHKIPSYSLNEEKKDKFKPKIISDLIDKLESNDDELQCSALSSFYEVLESPYSADVIKNGGKEAFAHFMGLAWSGCSEITQNMAICCLLNVVSGNYFPAELLIKKEFLYHLIDNHLVGEQHFVNCTLKLLSIIYGEFSEARSIINESDILQKIMNLGNSYNIGEILYLIIQHGENPEEYVELASLMMEILKMDNVFNISFALKTFHDLILREWEIFNLEELHSLLPAFIESKHIQIMTSALSVLEYIQPNENDFISLLNCIKESEKQSIHAIGYLKKTIPIWTVKPFPKLIETLKFCLDSYSYRITKDAIQLIIQGLNANASSISKELFQSIAKLLPDSSMGQYAIIALSMISTIVQSKNDDWLKEQISEWEDEILQFTSSENDEIANAAQAILDAAYQ